ncbi:hypothetical protein ACJMK2_020377 [Sinanodonta woodiana]|uniref:Secreted frizzled-related protein 3 n=1 Tax=Sinanodonta woodiana TaxID=1069815 RepID=A0ABD3U099_SINWO
MAPKYFSAKTLNLFSILMVLNHIHNGYGSRMYKGIDRCEPIKIPMCKSMPYNMTRMPNHLYHSTQENANLAIEQFHELIKTNCSADLLFFLCAMFAPICTPEFQPDAIPPCKSVCESSRQGCEPLMIQHNVSWPDALNCDLLPQYDRGVCVSPDAIVSTMPNYTTTEGQGKYRPGDGNGHECKCKKPTQPTKELYLKRKYDYAIAVRLEFIRNINGENSISKAIVLKVLKSRKVQIFDHTEVELWTNSSCVCPQLSSGREYFLIGYEDQASNKLLFTESTLVSRWDKKLEKKFMRWNTTKKGKESSKCKRNKDKNQEEAKCKRKKTPKEKSAENLIKKKIQEDKIKRNRSKSKPTENNRTGRGRTRETSGDP